MLDQEFKYFLEHKNELVKKYNKKFVVIKNNEVIGYYDTDMDAYFTTLKTHDAGTFLIQYVEPGDESYTKRFHSRVAFA